MPIHRMLKYSLFCSTLVTGFWLSFPAAAQTDQQLESIEQQIKALQRQLGQVKADLAARDRALKAAQAQAKAALKRT